MVSSGSHVKALERFRAYNPFHRDVIIDALRVSVLPEEDALDRNIKCIASSGTPSTLVSRVPQTSTLSSP